MFNEIIDDYYKPILVKFASENNFEEYPITSYKHKNLKTKESIGTITPQLKSLINERKNSTQDEQKVQLIIAVIFQQSQIQKKKYIIYIKSKNI